MREPIRVAIIDDDPLVRSAVTSYLQIDSAVEVVAQGADGADAVAIASRLAVDVLICDVRMPGLDGIEATAAVRRAAPSTKVLLLTSIDDDALVRRGLAAGAGGYLTKDTTPEVLVAGVRAVHVGGTVVSPETLKRTLHVTDPMASEPPIALSTRENDILQLLCRGASNQEIADQLFLSESTVKTNVSALLGKLRVTTRLKAVVRAHELGLVNRS